MSVSFTVTQAEEIQKVLAQHEAQSEACAAAIAAAERREERAEQAIADAHAQAEAAQSMAALAREREAVAALAESQRQTLVEGIEALRAEVEELYQTRQNEIDKAVATQQAAETARQSVETELAQERQQSAERRQRLANFEQQVAAKAHDDAQKLLAEGRAMQAAADQQSELVELMAEMEAACQARVSELQSENEGVKNELEASLETAHGAEETARVLEARLRANELHLDEQKRAASMAAAQVAQEHIQMVRLLESACHESVAAVESLRRENAGLLLDREQERAFQLASSLPGLHSESNHSDNREVQATELDDSITNSDQRSQACETGSENKHTTCADDQSDNISSSKAEKLGTSSTVVIADDSTALQNAEKRAADLEREVNSLRKQVQTLERVRAIDRYGYFNLCI